MLPVKLAISVVCVLTVVVTLPKSLDKELTLLLVLDKSLTIPDTLVVNADTLLLVLPVADIMPIIVASVGK